MKLSAFIITKNEEKNIKRALESIKWVDEIIVVDGFSTDKTCEIAKKYGAKIILSKFEGFDKEKNKAIKACKHEWILEIDADEELTKDAKKEIREAIKTKKYEGYKLIREDKFLGRVLINAPKLRLYKNQGYTYKGYTHEVLQITGKIGKLKTHINHYNNPTLKEHFDYTNSLSTQEVEQLTQKKISRLKLLILLIYRPIKMFLIYYLYFRLILKGFPGLFYSFSASFHEMMIIFKYYEKTYVNK